MQDLKIPNDIISQRPSVAQLNSILSYFVTHTTFSTIDIHMQRPLPASPQQAFKEVFCSIGGGNCFQINGAMFHLLTELGYQARLFPSHVRAAEGHIYDLSQESHMTLLVEFDQQKYIIDPGWGNVPSHIIAVNGETATAHNNKWRALNENTTRIAVQLYLDKEQKWQTQFDFDHSKPLPFAAFQPLINYVNSPQYPFYTFMLIMKSTATGTHTITNNKWVFSTNEGTEQTLDIIKHGGLKTVLHEYFGLQKDYIDSVQLNLFSESLQKIIQPLWHAKPKQIINVQLLAQSLTKTFQQTDEDNVATLLPSMGSGI